MAKESASWQLDLWPEDAGQMGRDDESSAARPPAEPHVAGGLLGLACGDALAASLGARPGSTADRQRGIVTELAAGGGRAAGQGTAVSQAVLGVAEAIVESPLDPVPGCAERIGKVANELAEDAATGSGSLGRTLPIALAYEDERTLLVHAARISALTHWAPQPEVCCAVYGLWIRRLTAGADRYAGWREALRAARDYESGGALALDTPGPRPLPDRFWSRLEDVTDLAYRDLQPSGYCLESLEAAAWCAIFADDAEQAIVDAVHLGGASNVVGSLAGGAAGVYWGTEGLPPRWIEPLASRRRILGLAHDLARLRIPGFTGLVTGKPP